MKRTKRTKWALSVLLTLGTAALGLAPIGSASAGPSDQPLSPGLLPAMQRDLGLTAAQAKARLQHEAAATTLAPRAEKAAGADFGGSWYDPASGKLVVGLTDGSQAGAVQATGATVAKVAHSSAQLDGVKAALDARAKSTGAPAAVYGWQVDPRTSSVVVDVKAGAEDNADVTAFLAAAGKTGMVQVEKSAAAEQPKTFAAGTVGGDPWYINNSVRCSIGFSVHGGFVSAGHCGSPGSSVTGWDGSWMGTISGSSFPGNDYSYVTTGGGWWNVGVVLGWGTVSDVLVRGSGVAPVGSSICRSGSTTHWHCGTVLSQNDTVNYSQGAVYEMTGTSVCAEPGDSGGSFISGDQAQGMTSGGWGNCTDGGQTWFQPVNEVLSVYGLSLVTDS